MHDVIVIGAGPVGSYAACELSRSGFEVAVLEKESLPKPAPVCTGVIGLEAFDEFNLPKETVLSTVKDIALFSPTGKTISYHPLLPQAYAVDRSLFDSILQDRAKEAGATILSGTKCTDVRIESDSVKVQTNRGREPVRGKIVILASGYNPSLSSRLGLGRIPDHFEGVQAEGQMADLIDTEIYVGRALAPSSFAWALPLPGGRARLGLATQRNAVKYFVGFLNHALIRDRLLSFGPFSRKPIPYGQLERTFADRVLVAGEAAGQVKSTTHGGVYYGLIGARCAVETVAEALKASSTGSAFLSRYERKWRQALEKELNRGFLLRRFFSRLSDKQIDRMFDLSAKDGIMAAVREKARFDWHHAIISSLVEHPLLRRYFGGGGVSAP